MQLAKLSLLGIVAMGVAYGYVQAVREPIRLPLESYPSPHPVTVGEEVVNYYTPIGFGWPSKFLLVQFDTDLASSFVFLKQSAYLGEHGRAIANGYEYTSGSEHSSQTSLFTYQDVQMKAQMCTDSVLLQTGNFRSRFDGLQFMVVINQNELGKLIPNGYFGLSPEANLLKNWTQTRVLDSPKVTTWFAPHSPESKRLAGEIVIGAKRDLSAVADPNMLHKIAADKQAWTLNLNKVVIGSYPYACDQTSSTQPPCLARLSTGTSNIMGPIDDVRRIYEAIGVRFVKNNYVADCNSFADSMRITFVIDDFHYSIGAQNFVKKLANGRPNECYVSIKPSQSNDRTWILGTDFMQSVNATFDYEKKLVLLEPVKTG